MNQITSQSTLLFSDGVSVDIAGLIRLRALAADLGLSPNARVQTHQAGGYASVFRGSGMDFDESRLYAAGDDVRNIDWLVTARTGKTHTKIFKEERERPVFLVVDLSPEMYFATRGAFKSVRAVQIACLIAWAAADRGDRVGAIIQHANAHYEVRPVAREKGVLQVIQKLVEAHKEGIDLNLNKNNFGFNELLKRVAYTARPGSMVFIISDFQQLDEESENHIKRLSLHQDIVAIDIHDPMEAELPPPAYYRISNGQQETRVDTGDNDLRSAWKIRFNQQSEKLKRILNNSAIHSVSISTVDDIKDRLRSGLHQRQNVRKR